MSDQNKKYESVLVGWADEPRYNDNGDLMGWSFRLKDNELKDCIDQYTTKRDANGQAVTFDSVSSCRRTQSMPQRVGPEWRKSVETTRLKQRILILSRSSIRGVKFQIDGGAGASLTPFFPLKSKRWQTDLPYDWESYIH